MKKLCNLFLAVLAILFVVSCNDDDVATTEIKLNLNNPDGISDIKLSELTFNARNLSTGQVYNFAVKDGKSIKVEEGIYILSVEGNCSYTKESDGETKSVSATVRGIKYNEKVAGSSISVSIDLFLSNPDGGFVVSEIFFAGTLTPEEKQYSSDKYIEIFNNSGKVLYADGLAIAETQYLTTMKQDYRPDIRPEAVAIDGVYVIPGDGDDYPVQPGETILICDVAIDHRKNNANSLDLSKADFEWFDDYEETIDTDVPEVPNMIKVFSSSATVWSLHNRGYKSFVLFRLDKMVEEFIEENKFKYEWDFEFNGKVYPMSNECYKIPNSWVIDAVGLSAPSEFEWNVLDPSLDISYTYSGDSGEERYGKSVSRKVVSTTADGKMFLKDTNDSAKDFTPTTEPTPGYIKDIK